MRFLIRADIDLAMDNQDIETMKKIGANTAGHDQSTVLSTLIIKKMNGRTRIMQNMRIDVKKT